jgi:hypothetical protein
VGSSQRRRRPSRMISPAALVRDQIVRLRLAERATLPAGAMVNTVPQTDVGGHARREVALHRPMERDDHLWRVAESGRPPARAGLPAAVVGEPGLPVGRRHLHGGTGPRGLAGGPPAHRTGLCAGLPRRTGGRARDRGRGGSGPDSAADRHAGGRPCARRGGRAHRHFGGRAGHWSLGAGRHGGRVWDGRRLCWPSLSGRHTRTATGGADHPGQRAQQHQR